MKKVLLCAVFIVASFTSIAQIGVGTNTPAGALDVVSSTNGFVMPRVANTSVVVNPSGGAIENGTMVYDLSINCINVYANGAWTGCIQSAATPPIIVTLTTQVASDGAGGTYTFLNHNLGADTSLDPHTPVVGLQGGYVQWGKKGPANWVGALNDGPNGFAAAPTVSNDNAAGITGWSQTPATNGSWNADENDPAKLNANDPCPTGYRVPTRIEWQAVNTNNANSLTGAAWSAGPTEFGNALHYGPDANGKLLTLPAAGSRSRTNGALNERGNTGDYWSSTERGDNAYSLYFGSSNVTPANNNNRTNGLSVRCIAE